jgi:hypothetical protein
MVSSRLRMAKRQQFSGLFGDLPHRKRLALWAFRANQHHRHFAGGFTKLRHKPQLIGAARQTSHRELAKRAFAGRLRRLIILSALKTAGGIHGDSLCRKVGQSLSTAWDVSFFLLDFLGSGVGTEWNISL